MDSIEEAKQFLENTAEEINYAKDIDRNEMYKYLISFGDKLNEISDEEKIDENFVKGCTSNVYISAKHENRRVYYTGSADSVIVKGYLSILIIALSGLESKDIESTEDVIEKFAEKIDIKSSLTPSRANAFGNIYKTMKNKALSVKSST